VYTIGTASTKGDFISILSLLVGSFICLIVLAIAMRRMAKMDAEIDQIYQNEIEKRGAADRSFPGWYGKPAEPSEIAEPSATHGGVVTPLFRSEGQLDTTHGVHGADADTGVRALLIQHIMNRK